MYTPSSVLKLAGWMLVAIMVTLGSSRSAMAGETLYSLRTEPPTPIAGQPFNIVFDPIFCGFYFSVDPIGEFPEYGGVTVAEDVIVARFGVSYHMTCPILPTVTRQPAPALPAGNYSIQLVLQVFPPPPNELVVEELDIVVIPAGAGASTVQIPSADVWTLLGLALLLAGVGVLSPGHRRAGR